MRASGVCDSAGGSWVRGSGSSPSPGSSLLAPRAGEPTSSRASTSCPPRVGCGRPGPELFQNLGEGPPAEVGHANGAKPGPLILVDGENRYDVGVLQPGQGVVLAPLGGGDLQDHRPAGQVRLLREVHPGERPAAQRLAETKTEQLLPLRGEPQQTIGALSAPAQRVDEVLVPHQGSPARGRARESVSRSRPRWAVHPVPGAGRSPRRAGWPRRRRPWDRSANAPDSVPAERGGPPPNPPAVRRAARVSELRASTGLGSEGRILQVRSLVLRLPSFTHRPLLPRRGVEETVAASHRLRRIVAATCGPSRRTVRSNVKGERETVPRTDLDEESGDGQWGRVSTPLPGTRLDGGVLGISCTTTLPDRCRRSLTTTPAPSRTRRGVLRARRRGPRSGRTAHRPHHRPAPPPSRDETSGAIGTFNANG